MKNFVTKLLQQERSTNKKAIPADVREELHLGENNEFDQNDVKLVCHDEGDKGLSTFYLLFCHKCKELKTSMMARKFPTLLPTSPTIKDIQDSWDQLIAADPSIEKEVDICGTLLPNDPTVFAGPNNRRFILRPVDHADKNKDVHVSNKSKVPQKRPSVDVTVEVPAKKNTFVQGNNSGNKTLTHAQCTKEGKSADGKVLKVTEEWQVGHDC